MSGPMACRCIVEALAASAVDPATRPGQCCVCPLHGQLVVWDGALWHWSNQTLDVEALLLRTGAGHSVRPRPADAHAENTHA